MSLKGELEQKIAKEWSIEAELESTGGIEYEILVGEVLFDRTLRHQKRLHRLASACWTYDGQTILDFRHNEPFIDIYSNNLENGEQSKYGRLHAETFSRLRPKDTKYGFVDDYHEPTFLCKRKSNIIIPLGIGYIGTIPTNGNVLIGGFSIYGEDLYLMDIKSKEKTLIAKGVTDGHISDNGQWIAYQKGGVLSKEDSEPLLVGCSSEGKHQFTVPGKWDEFTVSNKGRIVHYNESKNGKTKIFIDGKLFHCGHKIDSLSDAKFSWDGEIYSYNTKVQGKFLINTVDVNTGAHYSIKGSASADWRPTPWT